MMATNGVTKPATDVSTGGVDTATGAIDQWESKEILLNQVPDFVPNGSTVYIGSTAATPEAVLKALVSHWKTYDIQIIQMVPGGNLPHLEENIDRFRTMSFFSYHKTLYYPQKDSSESINMKEGLADYKPMSISSIGRLLEEKIVTVDIAIIKVTKPHKGFCSLGFGVDCTLDVLKYAKFVIAEVTDNMPWTEGPSKIPTSSINHWILHDDNALKTTIELWPEYLENEISNRLPASVIESIGKNIAKEIPDGSTLKLDWHPLVYSVFPYLDDHKDLGLHTDVFVDGLFHLQEKGIINNSKKPINTGRSVVSQAHGSSKEFYNFLDHNPVIEFHPSSYIDDPLVMAQINNLIVLIAGLKIDLTGQVSTDSIGHKFYGGIWSTQDSIIGARLSENGKPIVILSSISSHGRSNIVFALPPGTGISITRSDVEYVVTEYGTAYLYGKSIRERCLALIEIAHPDFRTELFTLAKEHQYLSKSQPGYSFRSTYPEQFECTYISKKTNRSIFIRPIKAADEDLLRTFFHKLSDHSVYLRYFRRLRSMSHQILQRYTDLDYSNDMALMALYPIQGQNDVDKNHNSSPIVHRRNGNPAQQQYELIGIVQLISDHRDGIPDVAFQVRDDWQGEGLASFLFLHLIEVSTGSWFNYTQLKADVLSENRPMRHVFEKSGIPYTIRSDIGVITYIFDLSATEDVKQDKP